MIKFREGSLESMPSKLDVDFPENIEGLDDYDKEIYLALWSYGLDSKGTGNSYIWLTKKQAEELYKKLKEKLRR